MRHTRRALLSLPLLLAACGDDDAPRERQFAEDVEVRESVGSEGGEIESKGVRLSIPQDALAEPVEIGVRTIKRGEERPLPDRTELESRAYELTPHGQDFDRSVELRFSYEEPVEDRTLRLARLEDEQDDRWEVVRDASFEGDEVSVRLDRFSIYAVVSCEATTDGDCGLDTPSEPMPPDAGSDADVLRDAGPVVDGAIDAGLEPFAQLSVFPAAANFGDVPVATGQSLPVTLTFENTGTGDATGCALSTTDAAFVVFNDRCTATLPAGGSCTVDVRGEVSAAGTISGALQMQCDGGLSAAVNLSVRGTEPALVVTPTNHSFGPVLPSTSETTTITFRNDGLAPATGCAAPVLSGTDASVFNIEQDNCGTSDLAPGVSCSVTVSLAPPVGDTAERRATLLRDCDVGGSVSTASDGLVGNRPHYLFITSTEYDGNLGGLAGADSECQAHADSVGSESSMRGPFTWRALLSTDTVDARDRINWQGPVFDVRDHFAVADPTVWPWTMDGVDPGTPNLLGADENGMGPGSYAWSGSTVNGVAAPALNCGNWTNNTTADGQYGSNGDFPAATWLVTTPVAACDDPFYALICVSDYP